MDVSGKARNYRAAECVLFRSTRGEFGGLSNMAPGFPLEVNGVQIRTTEALYQACRFPHMPEVQRQIINERSPMTAKMKSKPRRDQTRRDWYEVRIDVMRWCLRVKMAQNWDRFSRLLVSTGDRPIVEDSSRDAFWGAKRVEAEDEVLRGVNALGRLLMELRDELRSDHRETLRRVDPPAIPDFQLLGRPIGSITPSDDRPIPQADLFPEPGVSEKAPAGVSGEPQDEAVPSADAGIPRECKRLAEVDFPIAAVSRHSAREKSIRHGHPSTLHLWWARRPLAACRAVLMGLLLPDPCDEHCPAEFKAKAREALKGMPNVGGMKDDEGLRKGLLAFIADFANWDHSTSVPYLKASRALVKAAHGDEPPLVVDPFAGGGSIPLEALRVGCDAFASDLNPVACLILKVLLEDIPRHGAKLAEELRRVGAEVKEKAEKELAQYYPADPDLPAPRREKYFVYVLECSDDSFYIGQTDDIPRRLQEHEEGEVSWTAARSPFDIIHWETFDSRKAAVEREKHLKTGFGRKWLKREWKAGRLAARQAGGARPIAYLWARTVRCESPNCGAEIPLARSFWLCRKQNRRRALKYEVKRPKGKPPRVEFEIFTPKSESEVLRGTVARANATCPCCNTVLPASRVRTQLAAQRGGADVIFDEKGRRAGGALLLAVVTLNNNSTAGRHYRLPTNRDYDVLLAAQKAVAELPKGLVPDESLPPVGTLGFRVQRYGVTTWGDLFTARQKVALAELSRHVPDCEGDASHTRVVAELLASCIGKQADLSNSCCGWEPVAECPKHLFGRQAIPIVWDFPEGVPMGESSGSWDVLVERAVFVLGELGSDWAVGQVRVADATASVLPAESCAVWFSDPPYYDAVPYADLSDFFYVWLKRALPDHPLLRNSFEPGNPLTPKCPEIIQDETKTTGEGQPKDRAYFEEGMARAFAEGRHMLTEDGIGAVVFAHKTTEGWEALLSGMLRGGWVITASWPITTEMGSRLRARDSAALAASVHLICRPRVADASVGGWESILRDLPPRVGQWMERLAGERIRGADLVFSCIGPAMELFSRYSKVETAEGEEVGLAPNPSGKSPAAKRGFLSYVWEAVGRAALRQVLGTAEATAHNGAAAAALEDDARLTALFLWTLQSTNGGNGNDRRSTAADDEETAEEEETPTRQPRGYALIYDVARRFAQPLGIELEDWKGRIIEIEKGVVRLISPSDRARQLFGEDGASAVAEAFESGRVRSPQLALFPEDEMEVAPRVRGRARRSKRSAQAEPDRRREPTTLDRVHAAMLLQASGQSGALRALLEEERDRSPDFFRLANALSALYPKTSEEKRLIDAVLAAVPR